jgi:predicted nucleic acid-binding protein
VRTALDSNVLAALCSGEPLAPRLAQALGAAQNEGALVICGVVYAELFTHPRASKDFVTKFLSDTGIDVDFVLEEAVWRNAAERFAAYARRRRKSRGGPPQRRLADFLIGAHALEHANRLMTLDAGRYERDFPDLEIGGWEELGTKA